MEAIKEGKLGYIYLIVSDTYTGEGIGSNICCMGVYANQDAAIARHNEVRKIYPTEMKKVALGEAYTVDECFLGGYVG